jgi:hypothetical protein
MRLLIGGMLVDLAVLIFYGCVQANDSRANRDQTTAIRRNLSTFGFNLLSITGVFNALVLLLALFDLLR